MNDKNSWQTIALYAIILTLSLLLWQAWQTRPPQTTTQTANQNAATPGLPVAPHALLHTHVPKSRQLHLRSDVLDLTLDRKGGTIIRAQLLTYYTKLHGTIPITILSNTPDDYFIAQTGTSADAQLLFSAPRTLSTLQTGQDHVQTTLTATNSKGLRFTKTFVLERGKYAIQIKQTVRNQSTQPWEGQFFVQLKQKKPETESLGFGQLRTYQGLAYYTKKTPYEKLPFDTLDKSSVSLSVTGGWIASQQHYFITAWIPAKHNSYQLMSSKLPGSDHYAISLTGMMHRLLPNETVSVQNQLYVGPEHPKILGKLSPGLELTIDYGWLWFISDGLYWLLAKIQSWVSNWGVSIILLTLIIKLLFYRLSDSSFKSMAKMKTLQPKIEALKKKHGDNKETLGPAMMALYKKEKVNPVGGCLPLLIQIPFFIALYWVLMESVELRHAPFFGWIQDLSTKDPYYILPVVMGLTMVLQQRLGPQNPDPVQARMMLALPVIFTIMFLSFPSGLVLYWLTNNVLSIAQQWYCTRKHASK